MFGGRLQLWARRGPWDAAFNVRIGPELAEVDGFVEECQAKEKELVAKEAEVNGALKAAKQLKGRAELDLTRDTVEHDEYVSFLESHKGLTQRPYREGVHNFHRSAFMLTEYLAAVVSFQASVRGAGAESFLLPAGFVYGLVLCAENGGALLKYLHVARHLRKQGDEAAPPPELFSGGWVGLLVTVLLGIGIAAGCYSAYLIREHQLTDSVDPEAFLFIALAVAMAAVGENYRWTNPWLEVRETLEARVAEATDNVADYEEEVSAREGEVEATELERQYLPENSEAELRRKQREIELKQLVAEELDRAALNEVLDAIDAATKRLNQVFRDRPK